MKDAIVVTQPCTFILCLDQQAKEIADLRQQAELLFEEAKDPYMHPMQRHQLYLKAFDIKAQADELEYQARIHTN